MTIKERKIESVRKICSKTGQINRTVLILLIAVCVMVVIVIAIPAWNNFRAETDRIGCEQAMKSAKDGLIIEYLGNWKINTTEEVRKILDEVMPARENLCPSGGNVYLIPRSDGVYETVCGVHDPDEKLRTRLNASYTLEELMETLRKERRYTTEEPKSVTVEVNSKPLECVRVSEEVPIRRGTATTSGYEDEGVVAFYMIDDKGKITYFIYADENHCAVWRVNDGWTGDSYN